MRALTNKVDRFQAGSNFFRELEKGDRREVHSRHSQKWVEIRVP